MVDVSKVHPIEYNDESMSCPTAKRSRSSGQLDISEAPWQSAITALLTCVSRQDCIEALSSSFRVFNHSNEQTHDEEMTSGADAALCRLLSFLLFKELVEGEGRLTHAASSTTSETQGRRVIRISDEITCTCQIIEMIYRCSKEVLETSFQKVGPDFLHLLSSILAQIPKHSTATPSADMKSAHVCLRSVTKVLCHYARVHSATMSMAHHPRILSLMISLLQHPVGIIPFEAHHNALWVLANMACCNENMQRMTSHDRLLDTIIQAANIMHEIDETRPIHRHALRLQHSAFRCLLNLSWDQHNKTLMSERDDLVKTIGKTVDMKTVPGSGNEARNSLGAMLLQTRMFALGTLRNIAHTPSPQKFRLCTTQDGMLLNLLSDTALSDEEDPSVRDKAFAVIFNLVSPDTAEMLILHPSLLDSLVEAASVPSNLQLQGASTAESASTMSFRSLNALDQAVATRGSEECHVKVRQAIEQVNMARRFHNMTVPLE